MPTIDDTTVEVTYEDIHRAVQHCVDAAGDAEPMADPDYVTGLVDGARHVESQLCLELGLDRYE